MEKIVSYGKHLQGFKWEVKILIEFVIVMIMLIADTEDDFLRYLCNFHQSCLKFNMKISIHKKNEPLL